MRGLKGETTTVTSSTFSPWLPQSVVSLKTDPEWAHEPRYSRPLPELLAAIAGLLARRQPHNAPTLHTACLSWRRPRDPSPDRPRGSILLSQLGATGQAVKSCLQAPPERSGSSHRASGSSAFAAGPVELASAASAARAATRPRVVRLLTPVRLPPRWLVRGVPGARRRDKRLQADTQALEAVDVA